MQNEIIERRTSLLENGLIWFGAAVSIAKIRTGAFLAPLGFIDGLFAIILGHIIGCVLLFFAGLIGGKVRKSGMDTSKMSFGYMGTLVFSLLNIVQLVGWTTIMIHDGANAVNGIFNVGDWIWCVVIGLLIVLWVLIGIKNIGKVNSVAMGSLFVLTLVLCFKIFGKGDIPTVIPREISFGAAVELSAAMTCSWLPLISDYTRETERPVAATMVSVIVHGIASAWMYAIGLGAAIFTGESDVVQIMLKAGFGVAGLVIIVFSTVTVTFLDVYSAGVSGESLSKKVKGKYVSIAVAVMGIFGGIFLQLTDISEFLYFIGSVFTPMVAIQIADFYILKQNSEQSKVNIQNLIIWFIGFVIYRILMKTDIVVGSALPDMLITILICLGVNKIKGKFRK